MEDSYALIALLCFAIAVMLFVFEIFIPSAGVLGGLSAISAVVGVVLLFMTDGTLGVIGMIGVLIGFMVMTAAAIHIYPDTPIAHMLTLSDTQPSRAASAQSGDAATGKTTLVGKRGEALTDLRPIGVVLIDDERVECYSARGMIDAGTEVEVISQEGMYTKVLPLDA